MINYANGSDRNNFFYRICFMILVCIPNINYAQIFQDSLKGRQFTIWGQAESDKIGRSSYNLDTVLNQMESLSLAQALEIQGIVQIRSNGAGLMASQSVHGTSAVQNQIIWNGIPLTNGLIGQLDLSLIPLNSNQSVNLTTGGGSDLWGYGAIGSTLTINDNEHANSQLESIFSYNSLNTFQGNIQFHTKAGKNKYSLSLGTTQGNNSFSIINYTSPLKEERSISTPINSRQAQLSFSREISPILKFTSNLLVLGVVRQIPTSLIEAEGSSEQTDFQVRWSNQATFPFMSGQLKATLGISYDEIGFKNTAIQNIGKFGLGFGQISWLRKFKKSNVDIQIQQRMEYGQNGSFQTDSEPVATKSRQLSAILFRYDFHFTSLLSSSFTSRLEHWRTQKTIPTGTLGLQYGKTYKIKAYSGFNYRFPSFNDLFWQPGGNLNLRSERSFNSGLEISLPFKIGAVSNDVRIEGFNHYVNDWIQWVPETQFFSPKNIQNVHSFGANLHITSQLPIGGKSIFIQQNIQYTDTKSVRSIFNNLGQQLPYIAYWTYSNFMKYEFKSYGIAIWSQFMGNRYTDIENSVSLDPFFVFSCQIQKQIILKKVLLTPGIRINNIFDTYYENIRFRPREPRFINFQLNLKII